jgi:DNA-binding response OmpR family regulator
MVLDLMLPDGDGADVLRIVRAKGLSIRVAVATGVNDVARLKLVAELNPDIVLIKPVNLQELLEILGIEEKRPGS